MSHNHTHIHIHRYSKYTIDKIVEEVEDVAESVAFLSTPSIYYSLKSKALKQSSCVFDVSGQRHLRPRFHCSHLQRKRAADVFLGARLIARVYVIRFVLCARLNISSMRTSRKHSASITFVCTISISRWRCPTDISIDTTALSSTRHSLRRSAGRNTPRYESSLFFVCVEGFVRLFWFDDMRIHYWA